ncbi:MAG: GDP-mannose 4,6-dehydratase [Verrucomicrobiota bacterium]
MPPNVATTRKVALITGITGQDGSYLTELLFEKGYEVHGIVRKTSNVNRLRAYTPHAKLHYSDLADSCAIRRIFNQVRPSEFYHLAGQSHVGYSFEIPQSTYQEIAISTLGILEICRDLDYPIRFYHAASSEVFGASQNPPQNEETPFRPTSPYGCAKTFATNLCNTYRQSYQMHICNGILFNHESPRRGSNYVAGKIADYAVKIKLGLESELTLAAWETTRDWGHAQDYVQAMWLMLQHETPDNYVVSSGKAHRLLDWVEIMFGRLDLDWKKYVKVSDSEFRPQEPGQLIGDSSKARTVLGWDPQISFEKMALEIVDSYYQKALKQS